MDGASAPPGAPASPQRGDHAPPQDSAGASLLDRQTWWSRVTNVGPVRHRAVDSCRTGPRRRVAPRVPKCPPGCPEAVPSSRAADAFLSLFLVKTGVNSGRPALEPTPPLRRDEGGARAAVLTTATPRPPRPTTPARGRRPPPTRWPPRPPPTAALASSAPTTLSTMTEQRRRARAGGVRASFSDEQKRRMQLVYLLHLRDLHRWRQIRRVETRLQQGRLMARWSPARPRLGCRGGRSNQWNPTTKPVRTCVEPVC